MTLKDIMKIGTKGMSAQEREQEQERRLKVAERVTLLGNRIYGGKIALKGCAKGSADEKKLNSQIKDWNRELNRIKGDESCWLKEAAWFIYA